MTKSATGTWHSAVVFGDTVDIELAVTRWGNTSFDVGVVLSVASDVRFTATITYVSVNVAAEHSDPRSVSIPDEVKLAVDLIMLL